MAEATAIARWIHLVAAAFWVGGMLFLVLVAGPALRRHLPERERIATMTAAGQGFLRLSWLAFALLAASGTALLLFRRVSWDLLFETAYGRTLLTKLLLVLLVLLLTWLHAGVFGKRLAELAASATVSGDDSPWREALDQPHVIAQRRRVRRLSVLFSSLTLALSLVILYLAARLVG